MQENQKPTTQGNPKQGPLDLIAQRYSSARGEFVRGASARGVVNGRPISEYEAKLKAAGEWPADPGCAIGDFEIGVSQIGDDDDPRTTTETLAGLPAESAQSKGQE